LAFAFGSRSSSSGHLMPRHFLREHGIDPKKDFLGQPQFSGAHDRTVQRVLSGKADAGALNSAIFNRLIQEGRVDPKLVRVIWVTPGYPGYIWAARETVPPEVRKKIVGAFRGLTPGVKEDDAVLKALSAEFYVLPDIARYKNLKDIATRVGLLK